MKSLITVSVLAWFGLVAQYANACPQEEEYSAAFAAADACDTNYGEVVESPAGPVGYCVPDAVAEYCIDLSSTIGCEARSSAECDQVMGQVFEACVQFAYTAGVR